MDTTSVTIVALAIILYSVVSARLRPSVITAPIVFVSFGLLIGNAGFRLLEFRLEHDAIYVLAEGRQEIFSVAMLTVALSVFSHGLTAYPLAKRYARRTERTKTASAAAEHKPISEMPFR